TVLGSPATGSELPPRFDAWIASIDKQEGNKRCARAKRHPLENHEPESQGELPGLFRTVLFRFLSELFRASRIPSLRKRQFVGARLTGIASSNFHTQLSANVEDQC